MNCQDFVNFPIERGSLVKDKQAKLIAALMSESEFFFKRVVDFF